MPLTKDEWIDIILFVGSGTTQHVACTLNETHRTQITRDTVTKLIQKFKSTGSVDDEARSGRPKTATDEGTAKMVLAALVKSPEKGTRLLYAESASAKAVLCASCIITSGAHSKCKCCSSWQRMILIAGQSSVSGHWTWSRMFLILLVPSQYKNIQ